MGRPVGIRETARRSSRRSAVAARSIADEEGGEDAIGTDDVADGHSDVDEPAVDWQWFEAVMKTSTVASPEGRRLLAETAVTLQAQLRDIRRRLEAGHPVPVDEVRSMPSMCKTVLALCERLGIDAQPERRKPSFI